MAYRITGSSDLYAQSGRRPYASINFVTCHDGFTLTDLVSFNEKHNIENMEDNHDGENNNMSWNMGIEGIAHRNLNINNARRQHKSNFITTLLLSQGVPMLLAGDEMGRTQNGNNNAYCQDNEISWLNWQIDNHEREFMNFVRRVIHIRKAHPVFRRRHFFQGRHIKGLNVKDILWLRPNGEEMTEREWNQHHARCLGLLLHGDAIEEQDERGCRIRDDTFLLLLNADAKQIPFCLPRQVGIARWTVEIDTCYPDGKRPDQRSYITGESYTLQARTTTLLRLMNHHR